MNAPERKVVYLAFCLFVIGVLVRILPWGLPTIESIQIEDSVQVPEKQPPAAVVGPGAAVTGPEVADSVVLDKIIADPEVEDKGKSRRTQAKKKKKVELPLHINSASAEDLCALNGVGPKLADKIIAYRDANGPFKSSKDLQKVPGIGPKKLESILPGVIFD